MKTMNFENWFAFTCGVVVYVWHSLLNVPTDLIIGFIKAALFGAAGMAGKELFNFIKNALIDYLKNRKNKK